MSSYPIAPGSPARLTRVPAQLTGCRPTGAASAWRTGKAKPTDTPDRPSWEGSYVPAPDAKAKARDTPWLTHRVTHPCMVSASFSACRKSSCWSWPSSRPACAQPCTGSPTASQPLASSKSSSAQPSSRGALRYGRRCA